MIFTKGFVLFCLLVAFLTTSGQDFAYRTFKDSRIINTHSVETLPKNKLDVRIGHRFGDMFGEAGGWTTLYGLESATDVLIGGEYGFTDNLTAGIYRNKGTGDLRQLVNTMAKYRLLRQNEQPASFSLTGVGILSLSTMEKNPTEGSITSFSKFSHRMMYTAQLLVGKKFSDRFSLQVSPGFTHRNIVNFDDENDIFSLGLAGRIQLTKVIALLADGTLPLNGQQSPFTEETGDEAYRIPLGLGVEFDTGGHVFQVNFTNARGMLESDYITNTTSNWADGEFRIGFTISRLFNVR